MTAPHFHTTAEAKAAIKKISHNSGEGDEGAPIGIGGGSTSVKTTTTEKVSIKQKGDDWVNNRSI